MAVLADAADTPRWWTNVGLDDEESLMASRGEVDPNEFRKTRGYGGGVLTAKVRTQIFTQA